MGETTRTSCLNCVFKSGCKSNVLIGCPCKTCIIRMICHQCCEPAVEWFEIARDNMANNNG
jgi:hypothetical protein